MKNMMADNGTGLNQITIVISHNLFTVRMVYVNSETLSCFFLHYLSEGFDRLTI